MLWNGTQLSLFVDDNILLIINPSQSLAAIQEVLHEFSFVSYYKLNATKSLILSLHMPQLLISQLQKTFPLVWADQSIPYLGIQLTASNSQICDLNYKAFLQHLH